MDATVVIATMLSAIGYGLIYYWKAWQTQDPKPPFDTYKFTATLIVALLVGLIVAFSGKTLDEALFLAQMAEYGFYVAMVETILKAIFSLIGKQWPTSFPTS